jgi:DNA repair exonuclease SbcCD ATPase subunit
MIYLEKINIHEFRGIRDLELNFCSINFAICGPNGTGKSGIVDAIEFALTGDISRLKGRGTGDLSVKDHAPHVDKRGKPEESYVELTFKLLASDKIITLKRDVKNKNKPSINPNDEETVKALEYINNHPEFVLSRREIIKYVMAEPSKRSEEIQSLLKLDKLDKLRANFQKIANNYEN